MTGMQPGQDLAEQLEAMRDDPNAWGEPEPDVEPTRKRKSERRQRGVIVSVRLTPQEHAEIQAQANEHRESVSGYLRTLALQVAKSGTPNVRDTGTVINYAGSATYDQDFATAFGPSAHGNPFIPTVASC